MPAVIANFASQHFYEGLLKTYEASKLTSPVEDSPLFRQPLVFIDTSGLPLRERKETARRGSENWGESGYVNEVEAKFIVKVAALYEREGREWVVIVPY